MMTYEEQFEKQFPSLPRKDFMLFSDEEELLMKNCLDKQRVKEAMGRCFERTNQLPAVGVAYELLSKELGL